MYICVHLFKGNVDWFFQTDFTFSDIHVCNTINWTWLELVDLDDEIPEFNQPNIS